jgi:alpha-tubulin suppressor-like RCC1 family protein
VAAFGWACGVTMAGRGFCWGSNSVGNLGDGTTLGRLKPRPIAGGLTLEQVSGRHDSGCAVTADQRAYCWGANSGGQLGDGTTSTRLEPTPVAPPL